MIPIISRDNKTLKLIRALQRKKGRSESGLYFAEGARLVDEAVKYRFEDIKFIIASDEFAEKNKFFTDSLDEKGKTVYTAKESIFNEVCNTETPQGVAAVLKIPDFVSSMSGMNYVLVLNGVSEPGNLGTIIRTAEAAGVNGIILLKGCADLYNPKTVRSTMGSIFRMPCMPYADISVLTELRDNGFTVAATALKDSVDIAAADIDGRRALVIGSEAFGVSDEVLNLSDIIVRIPMEGSVESLNAAVAAGIAMYMLKP